MQDVKLLTIARVEELFFHFDDFDEKPQSIVPGNSLMNIANMYRSRT